MKMIDLNNDELVELDTDEYGFVKKQNDLIQIKIWKFISDSMELIGTITFHYGFDDHIFKGIVNKKNSLRLLDTWFNTGISDFIVMKIRNNWFIDFQGTKKMYNPRQLSNIYKFKKNYYKYKRLKMT
jgi:hypothetical protein